MADDKLNLAIAQGAPAVSFSPLSSLLGDYVAGKQLAQRVNTIDAFQNGAPQLPDGSPDYAKMAATYYQLGDVGTATQLARLAAQRGQTQGVSAQPSAGVSGGAQLGVGGAPPQPSSFPVFRTPQDALGARLPSGSVFSTPDGRIKLVP
jgi:hypothetical protein